MPERATVNQVVQIGLESVDGTAVPALKRFGAMRLLLTPMMEFHEPIFAAGASYAGAAPLIRKWTEFSVEEAIPSYNEVIYPLSSILATATITVPGGATNARQWEYLPNTFGGDSPVTFTAEQGDNWIAERATGLRFNSWGYTITRDGALSMTGGGFGRAYTTGAYLSTSEVQTITITGSPTGGSLTITFGAATTGAIAWNATAAVVQTALQALSTIGADNVVVTGGPGPATPWVVTFIGALAHTNVAAMTTTDSLTGGTTPASAVATTTAGVSPTDIVIRPMTGSQPSVYVDTTWAGLGTTKELRDFEVTFSMADRYQMVWVVDAGQASYVAVVQSRPVAAMVLTLEANAAGIAYLANAEAGDMRFIRIEAKDSLANSIDAGVEASRYRFTHDIAARITAIGGLTDRGGVMVIPFTFSLMHDATGGRAQRVQVVTTATAL